MSAAIIRDNTMFNNNFRFENDAASQLSEDEKEKDSTIVDPADRSQEHLFNGNEKHNHLIRERTNNSNVGPEVMQSPKRTFASVMSDIFRRTSETSSVSDPPSRKTSHNNVSTARAAATALGLFKSHNPDVDSEEADAAMAQERRHSTASGHSGGDAPVEKPAARRPSYMPRNATKSFLKTATGTSEEKSPEQIAAAEEAAKKETERNVPRKTSIIGVTPGGDVGRGSISGRRPSGMVPNNVASRYVRSASMTDDEGSNGTSQSRRSSARSTRSRQNSGNNGDSIIKPVSVHPDQYGHWQNSVQRNVNTPTRTSFSNSTSGQQRQSIAEEEESGSNLPTYPAIAIQLPSPDDKPKSRAFGPASTSPRLQHDLVSPMTATFGPQTDRNASANADEEQTRPETPLESLGFKGAVPA